MHLPMDIPFGLKEVQAKMIVYGMILRSNLRSTVKLGVTTTLMTKSTLIGELLTQLVGIWKQSIFPVAWAVVNVKIKTMGVVLRCCEDLDILCTYMKFRSVYEVKFRNLFWQASKASYPLEFDRIMHEMKTANPGAYDYLMKRDPKTWSRVFFEFHSVCEAVENGFSECFNAIILKVRTKPIITILEAIRVILMERMERMRRISASWSHDICPVVIKRIEAAMRSQRYWQVLPGGPMVFEVRQQSDAFIVDEFNKTCSCRMWQLSGIPCLHAVATICYINKNPQDYVPDWFRRVKYAETYASHICAVQGINQWPPNELNKPLPPKPRTMPGRPKKKRKRAIHEPAPHVGRVSKVGTVITCKICGGEGHNRNGCKKKGTGVEKTSKGKATGKGKAIGKGKGIDKGKEIAMDDGDKREWSQTVGGFMKDARKILRPLQETMASQQEVQGKKVRKQRVKGQLPTRRQAQARISKINMQKKVPGPGNTRDDAMLVD
ncbi:hypothetical protein OSB04_030142 [Centaurea solstitialis]|uniref:SWIM-type domain-containing protein n=1 Tax=Centaurea solstitialis TaxID=347529 RepID=A0AA38W4N8_9ASTR|nr:hypothetical protein OSB04_030142 [Centaurea solstitialis]